MTVLELGAIGASLIYFAFLAGESLLLRAARRRLRFVVHVNGTRGKTETTRLIAAALRSGGLRTLAKTTGTLPLLILPDGSERRLRRLGAPNVREQRYLILEAARLGAEAVVAECMAVSPDAQDASTAFLKPDLLVVTNSRPDHEDVLGSPEEAARVFARGAPRGGAVLTADESILGILSEAAAERGASCAFAPPRSGGKARPENLGLALAAAARAGVAEDVALRGALSFAPDPGSFAIRRLVAEGGGEIFVADALAANDVASTELLFREAEAKLRDRLGNEAGPRYLLLAFRPDRLARSRSFADWALAAASSEPRRWDALLVAGEVPAAEWRRLRLSWEGQQTSVASGSPRARRLSSVRELGRLPAGSVVFAAGNWKGLGPSLAALAPSMAAAREEGGVLEKA